MDSSPKGNVVVISQDLISQTLVGDVSAQAAEITACILALQMFSDKPINLYTDSIYLSQIIAPLETAPYISPVSFI